MKGMFRLISSAATIYTFACCIRIWLTWAPNLAAGRGGRFLVDLCDPYLNAFRRFRFLRVGALDFSPAVGVGVLLMVSSVADALARLARVSVGIIAAQLVGVCWSIVSTIVGLVIILLLIRLVACLVAPRSSYGLWITLDQSLSPLVERLRLFFRAGRLVWSAMLAVSLLTCVLGYGLARLVAGFLVSLLVRLPF
ncbi:MAG: YggT family protein [Spirochaetaceae bacterium]|nr:YggT family protein [Spirochaetaceae bacterium]